MYAKPTRPGLALLVGLTLGLGSCGGSSHPTPTYAYTSVEAGAGTKIEAHGIEVLLDGTVDYHYTMDSVTGAETTTSTRIGGFDFELLPDRLVLGSHEFDGLVAGDHVRLGQEGIYVNDERRWDFPSE